MHSNVKPATCSDPNARNASSRAHESRAFANPPAGARFGIVIEFLEALCHAMQAERMQLIESGMGQHSSFSVS
jgi:hypothetical protein